jgi:deoxyribose-phosphate aldolase
MNRQQLAQYIDHTLLRPDATVLDVRRLVEDARKWRTYAVCINSSYVSTAVSALGVGSGVLVAATVGFPLGQASTAAKVAETRQALDDGADEIDMVWNLGRFLSDDASFVEDDIAAVVAECGSHPLKVILETARLTSEQIARGARLAIQAGAHTVKTSTGFGFSGATVDAVRVLRQAVGKTPGVKASGGIRSYHDALAMIKAGASRLGLSGTEAVLAEAPAD